MKLEVAPGSCDEEGRGLMNPVKACEVEITAIAQNRASFFFSTSEFRLKLRCRTGRVLKCPCIVLWTFLLRGFLQLDLLVEGRKALATILGVPGQCFKAVGFIFELNQQLVIQ